MSADRPSPSTLSADSERTRVVRGALLVVLLGFLYGSTIVVSRFSVGQYDPRTYISLRLLLAMGGHIAVYAMSANRRWPRDGGLWLRAGIFGVFGTAIPMTSIVSSLQYMSSGVSSLLLTLNPVVVVLLAQLFLCATRSSLGSSRRAWRWRWAGRACCCCAAKPGWRGWRRPTGAGYGWALLGVVGSAGASVYARRFLREGDAWDVGSIRMTVAALLLLPITYFTVGYDMSGGERHGLCWPLLCRADGHILRHAAQLLHYKALWANPRLADHLRYPRDQYGARRNRAE